MYMYYLMWNGSVVCASIEEESFKECLLKEVGIDSEWYDEHFGENVEVDEDEIKDLGWKWKCQMGDNYVEVCIDKIKTISK